MKTLYVGCRDPMHSSGGGYDKIMGNPGADVLLDKDVPFGFLPMHKSGKVINNMFLDLVARIKRHNYDVVHYFYGDMLIYPFCKSKKHKVVATIHMDIRQRKRSPKLFVKTLKSLDGVVSLSSSQQRLLAEWGVKSVFIPHGFDRPSFTYQNMKLDKQKINVVFIGSNYRDIDTLEVVVKHCLDQNRNVQFHLLGQKASVKERFASYANVTICPRLDDDKYYSVIKDCDYSFLPLLFATANNALLEAQFLGVTSILPQMDGIEDYASKDNIFYQTEDELMEVFTNLKKNKYSVALSQYSDRFLWKNIYPQLNVFYKSL